MDGCSTFQNAPQRNPRRSQRPWFKALYLLALALVFTPFSLALAKIPHPVAATVSPQEWAEAQKTAIAATLQVTFPTIMYDKHENIFSDILTKLPSAFSHLKLNTIGRGLHSTLAYLDGLTLDEAKQVIEFFKSCDHQTLEKYDLLRTVKVFDPHNTEFVVIGTKSKFIGLKPHKEFIDWQMRFYKLLGDKAPGLMAKHRAHRERGADATSADSVHISLVQFGDGVNIPLTDIEVQGVMDHIKTLFKEEVDRYTAEHGEDPEVLFSLKTHPIELVTAPVSIHNPPTPIVTLKEDASGVSQVSQIGRWMIEDLEDDFKKVIEFDVDALIAGKPAPYKAIDKKQAWIASAKEYEAMNIEEFKAGLDENMRRSLEIALKTLSETKYPAAVPSADAARQGQFFVAKLTHPRLAPQKGFEALETSRLLGFKSTGNVSMGMGLYASYVREEVDNPGDMDMLVNSLVHVPAEISNPDEAEAYAVRNFVKHTLGHLAELVRSGRISITELRLGSDATMGIPTDDVIDGLEENPYLSEQDVLNGTFKDKAGRIWTLEELVGLGDFMKGKVDLFTDHGRIDVSLQFLAGYEWNGTIYTFQKNGMKGIPPLTRTAEYDGKTSYAIAASLARPYDYYNVQKGSITARAIRDVVKTAFGHSEPGGKSTAPVLGEPLWNSKFIKKVYNYLILLRRSGMELDEIFFEEARQILLREGQWQESYSVKALVDRLVYAINQPKLKTLNYLKRNVIDFEEFSERTTPFSEKSWLERKKETAPVLEAIRADIAAGELVVTPKFQEALRAFSSAFRKASRFESTEQAIHYLKDKRLETMFKTLHTELTKLEGQMIAVTPSARKISEFDKAFIKTFIGYSPHFLTRYMAARSQDSDAKMQWTLKLMGIEPTEENIQTMRELSDGVETMNRDEFGKLQHKVFLKLRPSCADLLTKRGAA